MNSSSLPLFGSKAETLASLASSGFPVPALYYCSVSAYLSDPGSVMAAIRSLLGAEGLVACRSSAQSEDGAESSMAGAFQSLLNVPLHDGETLGQALAQVAKALPCPSDHILVQRMVERVSMSGVVLTHALDDGSPYYVINYDDSSGRSDTVTSGQGVHKTVYIYHGVKDEDFDSPRLERVMRLVRRLERHYRGHPLDLEFAVGEDNEVWLLQARRVAAARHWAGNLAREVSARIRHVERFVTEAMTPRRELFGAGTMFGVMPDWNPAEMIGVTPRPLAFSLYRRLITRRVWSLARARMGYRDLPPTELMVSILGRPYIDVRASFNSFLPAGLSPAVCEKLVNAWLARLDLYPNLHDKIEFEVALTSVDCRTEAKLDAWYPVLLSPAERAEYLTLLRALTNAALRPGGGSLAAALGEVASLRDRQEMDRGRAGDLVDDGLRALRLLEECADLGTLPFAVTARHAFIAEAILRSACEAGVLSQDRLNAFKRGVTTVSGTLTRDFARVLRHKMPREHFLTLYGHLRPGTYDILSASYDQRPDLFAPAAPPSLPEDAEPFYLSAGEKRDMEKAFAQAGLGISPDYFLEYAAKAISGREYAKFVFTRHVHRVLQTLCAWGEKTGLSPEDLSMLSLEDVTQGLSSPLPMDDMAWFRERVAAQRQSYALGRGFKLASLIRAPRDVYIVPQHRNAPNFITAGRVEAPVIRLGASDTPNDLAGRVVCIESADPGYDWIFTRSPAGLITRYGGANSHMTIRAAEYGLPAAIGCGDLLFDAVKDAPRVCLDCAAKTVTPLNEQGMSCRGSLL